VRKAALVALLLLQEQAAGVQLFGIGMMIAAIVVAQLGAGEHTGTYPLDPL
jgi:hypothetical protein